jgi:hypothetical protein
MKHCLIKQHWNGTPREISIVIKRDKVAIEGETDIIVAMIGSCNQVAMM